MPGCNVQGLGLIIPYGKSWVRITCLVFLSSLILSCCWSDFLSSVVQISISTFPLSLCVFVNEVCAFVCVCMLLMCTQCTCMYSVAYSHLCVSVEARGVALQEPSSIYLVFWDREFPLAWNSLVRLGWLTRKLKPSTYLCFLRARPPMDPCHIFCNMRLLYWKGDSAWKITLRQCDGHLQAHGCILELGIKIMPR